MDSPLLDIGRIGLFNAAVGLAARARGVEWEHEMINGLTPGTAFVLEFEVAESMCPHFDGALVHPVCATWTLCHQMEVAGRNLLAPYLEPHEEAVGAHISIDHRAPAVIGSRVRVRAEAVHATPRRLEANVTAHADDRLLASGRFVQIVLSKERLAAILDHLSPIRRARTAQPPRDDAMTP